MAEALGVASSITALIDASTAVISYLKAVKVAPKERKELLKELSDLNDWLSKVVLLTTPPPFTVSLIVPLTLIVSLPRPMLANDPWLATMQKLSAPFARLTELLNDLQKELEPASSGMKRLLWKFKRESVEDALKEIERIKSLMIVAVQRDHVALSHAIQEKLVSIDTKVDGVLDSTNRIEQIAGRVDTNVVDVRGQVAHIKDGVSQQQIQMQKAQDDETLMRVVTWLTDLNFKFVQVEKLKQRVGDTGRWFLESKLFKEWVDGTAPSLCLWCPGNRVGKTILTAIVIDYLRLLNHERKTLVLSIFCDYQSATAQTMPNLLCSLLKQLVQDNGLSGPITLLYNQFRVL